MFDFNEMENIEEDGDDLLEEGGEGKKKSGEGAEDWSLEEDLEDEENM